jgi:hypothetical protein
LQWSSDWIGSIRVTKFWNLEGYMTITIKFVHKKRETRKGPPILSTIGFLLLRW